MKGNVRLRGLLCCLAAAVGFFSAQGVMASTPGFTMTASNVSLSGQGSGSSAITLTSVDGYTGQVVVGCVGPNPIIAPVLVLPVCTNSTAVIQVPADGKSSGTIAFYPPWQSASASSTHKGTRPRRSLPIVAVGLVGLGLLGLRTKKDWAANVIALVYIGLVSGAIGCIGQGGLQMTPGTYSYTINASGTGASATTTISVTVKCSSCP